MTLFTDDFYHNPPCAGAPIGHVATTKKRNKGRQAVRVLVSFPSEFLSDVDKLATKEDRTRSELVREALRLYMKQAVKEDTP
jgi:hypothetical protein